LRLLAAAGSWFFEERCQKQGIFIFDEPQSALSPGAPDGIFEADAAHGAVHDLPDRHGTHSPMLMACPNARLLRRTKYGLQPVTVEETDHYKVMREICADPAGSVEAAIEE
jgi:predicted ATPase